uniref:Uncharacterized protein n=1 Tax=Romanomermis culicivorax TaxID=13658 RepID=A0A915HE45_ROMCU
MLRKTNRGTIPGSSNSGNNRRSWQDCQSGQINVRIHGGCRQECHGSGFLWRNIHSSRLVSGGFLQNISQCLIPGGICFSIHRGGLDWSRFVHWHRGEGRYVIKGQFQKIGYLRAVAVRSAVAASIGRANTSVDSGSFAMFKLTVAASLYSGQRLAYPKALHPHTLCLQPRLGGRGVPQQ